MSNFFAYIRSKKCNYLVAEMAPRNIQGVRNLFIISPRKIECRFYKINVNNNINCFIKYFSNYYIIILHFVITNYNTFIY